MENTSKHSKKQSTEHMPPCITACITHINAEHPPINAAETPRGRMGRVARDSDRVARIGPRIIHELE